MKNKITKTGWLILVLLLTSAVCMQHAQAGSGQPPSDKKDASKEVWYALIPPRGVETSLPSYDKWDILMKNPEHPEAMRLNTEATRNAVMESYFRNSGICPDGKAITPFQLNHIVFYNLSTRQMVKAPWGWK